MNSDSVPKRVSNDRIVGTYDRIATLYDWFVASLEAPTRAQALWTLDPSPNDRVLDLGCGVGQALVHLVDSVGPDGQVVGLDASSGMLNRAYEKVERGSDGASNALTLGDARSLPFKDETFDAIYLAETLELFSTREMRTVLEECRRVLRSDGRLVVASMDRAGWENRAFIRGYEWVYRKVPGYATLGCRPIYVEEVITDVGFEVKRSEQVLPAGFWPIRIVRAHPGEKFRSGGR